MANPMAFDKSLSFKFIFFLLVYFSLHILLRVMLSDSLDYDEAEQALLGQWLLAGYTEQPPLYTWIQYALFQVFGKTVFAISILKNILLFLTYLFVYLSAKKLLKNTRAAVLSASSMLLIPQIAWESQRDMTHTTLVVCSAAAILWTALRLIENKTYINYTLLGLFCGMGILAKVNIFIFFLILFITLLTFNRGRQLFFSRMILISLVLTAVMCACYLLWMFNNQEIVFSATHKFKQAVELYSIKGILSFVTNAFLFLTPLWIFYLLIFPRGYKNLRGRHTGFAGSFMLRYGIVFILTLLIVIIVFKVSYVKDRWMQPMLFAAPLIFFTRFDVTDITIKQYKRFCNICITAAVAVYIAFVFRVVGAPLTHHYCRLNHPFSAVKEEIQKSGFSKGVIISDNRFLAGNMHFKFPDSVALIPGYNFELLPYSSKYTKGAVIWEADRSYNIPSQLAAFITDRYGADLKEYPINYYEKPYKYSHSDKIKFGVILFDLPSST
jgi:lipopolysaccharide core galacturonosyltransferase RgtB